MAGAKYYYETQAETVGSKMILGVRNTDKTYQQHNDPLFVPTTVCCFYSIAVGRVVL